jgi:hypothetical protein
MSAKPVFLQPLEYSVLLITDGIDPARRREWIPPPGWKRGFNF